MVSAIRACGCAIPKAEHALARGSILRAIARELRCRAKRVPRLHVKSNDGSSRLPGNRRAKDAVPRNGVASSAIVSHCHGGVSSGGIDAVIDRD